MHAVFDFDLDYDHMNCYFVIGAATMIFRPYTELVFEIIFGPMRRQHFQNFEQIYFSKIGALNNQRY